jgi:hypothetical protein
LSPEDGLEEASRLWRINRIRCGARGGDAPRKS